MNRVYLVRRSGLDAIVAVADTEEFAKRLAVVNNNGFAIVWEGSVSAGKKYRIEGYEVLSDVSVRS